MQLSLNWLYTRKALRSCKEKLLHVVQSGSFLLYRTLGLLYSRCQLQGRREPVWDLPLTSSVVVSSTGPSFSGLPAVADPRLRKGALVLQGWLLPGQSCLYRGWGRCRRLVAPGPVTALGVKSLQLVLGLSAIPTLCESWDLPQNPFLWILKPVESSAFGAAAICATHGAVMDGSPAGQRDGSELFSCGTRGCQGSTATFSPAPFRGGAIVATRRRQLVHFVSKLSETKKVVLNLKGILWGKSWLCGVWRGCSQTCLCRALQRTGCSLADDTVPVLTQPVHSHQFL